MKITTKAGKEMELMCIETRKIVRQAIKAAQGNNRIVGTWQHLQVKYNPHLKDLYIQANKRSGRARQRWLDRISNRRYA